MFWVGLALASIATSELFLILPVLARARSAAAGSRKAMALMQAKGVSDHWKERALPAYAGRIALGSISALFYLLAALVPFFILSLFLSGGLGELTARMLRLLPLLFVIAISIGYIFWRTRGGDGPAGYSAADRLLHRIALNGSVIPEIFHNVEKDLYLKKAPKIEDEAHVFVCGLARAGSTILMREIYGSGAFCSLTYRDMPFVLAPNLGAKLFGAREMDRRERAHGDGISVDIDSPEALDEVYWRVTDGENYITESALTPHDPGAEVVDGYVDLVRLIALRYGKIRYLSKNNNNVLRIAALADCFENAVFLVPMRDPLQHAASLLRQHEKFSGSDGFTKDYMRWLGHHEFGETHKPMTFGDKITGDPHGIDYWLKIWIAVHASLKDVAADVGDRVIFVPSDGLAEDPGLWAGLSAKLGIAGTDLTETRSVEPREVTGADPELVAEARGLYAAILNGDDNGE